MRLPLALAAIAIATTPVNGLMLGDRHAAKCYLKNEPLVTLETDVRGGESFECSSAFYIVPEGADGAHLWLQRGKSITQGHLEHFGQVRRQARALGLFDLPAPDGVDPYGFKISLHVHDGPDCFAYSPQRGCIVPPAAATPSPDQKVRFKQICDLFIALQAQATTPATEAQLQAAERNVWKNSGRQPKR